MFCSPIFYVFSCQQTLLIVNVLNVLMYNKLIALELHILDGVSMPTKDGLYDLFPETIDVQEASQRKIYGIQKNSDII